MSEPLHINSQIDSLIFSYLLFHLFLVVNIACLRLARIELFASKIYAEANKILMGNQFANLLIYDIVILYSLIGKITEWDSATVFYFY